MSTINLPANIVVCEQQGPEWFQMRKGMCTGSMVGDAVAKMATQPSMSKKCSDGKHETCKAGHCNCPCHGQRTFYQQCRENYMMDLVATRLTGQMPARYVSRAMEIGIERESLAISAYEMKQNVMVEPVGFAFHPEINWYGASPDGLVGSDIVLEAKCPTPSTHLRYISEFKDAQAKGLPYAPEEYIPQIKAELSCTERIVCHFISFNPEFPEHLQLMISEWPRDRKMIEAQDLEVVKFLDETAELTKHYEQMIL